tara:strand:+ start:2546 stop:2935 length:390 start_codon:yes stop_codon:yes gene_type:complete
MNHRLIFIKLKPLIALILLSVLLVSCDVEHIKEYYVSNSLDSTVVLKFNVEGESNATDVFANEEQKIHHSWYVQGTVGVSDERERIVIKDLNIKYGIIEKEIDASKWIYEEIDKYHAIYRLSIDTNLIK